MNMNINPINDIASITEENPVSVPCEKIEEPNILKVVFPNLGSPKHAWPYRDKNSALLGYICRFEVQCENGEIKKEIRPYSYLAVDKDKPKWRWKGIPSPRPLYNLDLIYQNRSKTVLVCEGEKAADAASNLFPNYICTTPMFGAKSPHKTDWSILADRDIIIVGDHDAAGKSFANKTADLISKNTDVTIKIMDIEQIGKRIPSNSNFASGARSSCPEKYDLADALVEGWNATSMQKFIEENCDSIFKEFVRVDWPFRLRKKGVEKWIEIEGEFKWVPVFSYLKIEGHAASESSEGWSYVTTVKDKRNVLHTVLVKSADLNGRNMLDVKSNLSQFGLTFNQRNGASDDLWTYITHAPSKELVTLAEKTGWQSDKLYATSSWIATSQDNASVVFDDQSVVDECFDQLGSLDDWQKNVASYVEQSELLVFSISLAFVPPLLKKLGHNGFGFHLFGSSSTGKTTAMKLASSVWGPPKQYIKNWNLTSTALEGTAVNHNDTLLCLDEISQADPNDVSKAAYELANGQGKGRGNVKGGANKRTSWRLAFFSNGELPFDDFISSQGKYSAMAGQKARTLNIPADTGRGLGVFSALPEEFANAAEFADYLSGATNKFHGMPAQTFVENLLEVDEDRTLEIKSDISSFVDSVCTEDSDGQIRRVAKSFALVAIAGELAITFGILPWKPGGAINAAKFAFKRWLDVRGGTQSDEIIQGVAQVRSFLQTNGEERFTPMYKVGNSWRVKEADEFERQENHTTRNRAGYSYQDDHGDTVFLVFPDAWKTQICVGRDPQLIANELVKRGHMRPDKKSNSVTRKLPNIANKSRVYEIKSSIIADID